MISFDEYQGRILRFRNKTLEGPDEIQMLILGLASETGEIAEAIKHTLYHNHDLDFNNLRKELGDLLWYLTTIATHYGWTLEQIALLNIEKLNKRYPNGFTSHDSINRN